MDDHDRHPRPGPRRRQPRPRLPLPTWMQAWPRGVQPTSVCASPRGVELSYRAPGNRWFRVVATLARERASGLEVRGIPGPDPDAVARLAKAVEHRLQRSPPARRWLAEAAALIERLEGLRVFGGSGEAEPGIDALLGCLAELRDHEGETSPEQRADIERALAQTSGALAPTILAELGVALWLAAGAFERGLELWAAHAAIIEARDTRSALACAAIVHAFLGRVADAQARARQLAARSRDAIDARHAGELLEHLGEPSAALAQLRVAASDSGGDAGAFDIHRRLAGVAAAAGDRELVASAAAAMREHATRPEQQLAVAQMQREAGEFVSAEATLERLLDQDADPSVAREAAALLMSSRLWRGDHAGAASLARAALERDRDDATATRTLGAAEHLAGRSEAGLALLTRARTLDGGDDEARLWRAEVLDRLGRYSEARDEVLAVRFGDLPAWQLLRALIEEHGTPRLRIELDTWFIVDQNIRQLLGDEAPPETGASHEIAVDAITRALAKLGGNRSARLTTPTPDGSLRWLEVESPRHRSERLQLQATQRSVDEVIAEFEALAARHPEVPFFTTYAAELLLWRGEYEAALARFERIWVETRTRWGYVGSGAAAMLLGRDEQALRVWDEGKDYYEWIPAEATYCYRGELYRRRGELERARPDLEQAVAARPGRLGAWVNLALLEHAAGREAALREAVTRVETLCPAYAWTARRAAKLDGLAQALAPDELARWMEALLELMRGNRSSVMYTIVDEDQRARLRVIPAAPTRLWTGYLRRSLALFEDALLTELAQSRP